LSKIRNKTYGLKSSALNLKLPNIGPYLVTMYKALVPGDTRKREMISVKFD